MLNEHMITMIDEMRSDSSVGFAHTISADFGDPKHMSAGVAVIFRNKFGRPQSTDYISKNLTKQQYLNKGATVFSLVTKEVFWGKPSKTDYDSAFKQLTENFKSSGLKTLVCSPMGCVRDLIEVDHFIQKLVEFQQATEATIIIVSYFQKSIRILRNGFSHTDFVRALEHSVVKWTAAPHTQQSSPAQNAKHQQPTPSMRATAVDTNIQQPPQQQPTTSLSSPSVDTTDYQQPPSSTISTSTSTLSAESSPKCSVTCDDKNESESVMEKGKEMSKSFLD